MPNKYFITAKLWCKYTTIKRKSQDGKRKQNRFHYKHSR